MADINVKVKVDDSELTNLEKKLNKTSAEVDVKVTGQGDLKQTSTNINNMTTAAQKSNGVFATLKGKISDTFSSGRIATTAFLTTLYSLQKAGSAAKKSIEEINSSIVDLQIATNDTYENTKKLVAYYNDMGQKIGATTTDVSSAADDWLRSGKTISEANKLIQDSLMLSKLGQIDSSEATSDLLAISNAYDLATDEVERAVDKLTAVDMISAASAGGLATSINKTASAASLAGVEFDKLVGYIAAVKNQTQQSDEVIGNAFKSIFARMNKVKAGADVDDLGESLNDVEKVLKNIGVALRDTNGNWYDSDQVLDDIGAKWGSLSDTMQKQVATALGGTYQYNNAIALLNNYSDALKYTEVAANSAGTAIEKYNNSYLNSIEAKKNQLQASFESLVLGSDAQEVYKSILDIANAMLKLTEKTNILKSAFAGLMTAGVIKVFTSIKTGVVSAYAELNNFNNAMKMSVSADNFNDLLSLTKNLSESQTNLILSSKNLSNEQRIAILTNQNLTEAEVATRLSTLGLSDANKIATGSTKSLSNAWGGLVNTIKANPIGAISAAVTAAVVIFNILKKVVDENTVNIEEAHDATQAMIESMNSAKSEADSNAKAISDLKDEYASLAKGVNTVNNQNLSLSTEDFERYLEINNEIADMYPKLVKGYDAQGNAILDLQGNIENLTVATEEAQRAAYALTFTGSADIENSGFDSVVKSYLSDTSGTGAWYDNFWKKLGHKFTTQRDVGIDLSYQDAITQLQNFVNASVDDIALSRNMDLNMIAGALDVSYREVFNATGNDLQQLKNQAQTVINSYQQIMDDALNNMQVAAEGYLKGVENTAGNLQSGYDTLNENQQNLVSLIVTNMSQDTADAIANAKNPDNAMRQYVDDLVNMVKYGGSEIEEAYSNITNILSDTDSLTTDALGKLDGWLNKLSSATGQSTDSLKEMFGVDYLYDTEKAFNANIKKLDDTSLGQKKLTEYTKDFNYEQKQAWLTATNGCYSAQAAITAYENSMASASKGTTDGIYDVIDAISEADSAFSKVQTAQEGADYGDTYDSMASMIKEAKELAEDGDIGSKVFKSVAAMISPSGADDYANWLENLPRIERYWKENTSDGMLNFLDDLKKKGYATQSAMGEWTLTIEDLEGAAKDLNIGFEPFMALLDELSKKGFVNDFISTPEEGIDYLTDLTKQLYEAEAELYELEQNDPGNSTAIQAKKDEIDQLKQSIDSTSDSLEKLLNKSVEDRKEEDEKNRIGLNSIIEQYNKNSDGFSDEYKKMWAEEIISTGSQKGYTIKLGLDGELYLDTSEAEESVDEVRSDVEDNPIEGKFSWENVNEFNQQQQALLLKIEDAKNALSQFTGSDGKVNLTMTGAQEAQQELESLLRQMQELSNPAIMSVDISSIEEGKQEAIFAIQEFQRAVNEYNIAVAIGADTTDAEANVLAAFNALQEQSEILASIGVDTTDVDTAVDTIQALTPQMIAEISVDDKEVQKYKAPDKTAAAIYGVNSVAVDNWTPKTKYGQVVYNAVTTGISALKAAAVHVKGTLHSFASGTNVSIDHDQEAVVNEIGDEGLIRNGILTRIKGGMQTIRLKAGDIILNHKQMEELDKNGKVTSNGGRGKLIGSIGSFVKGTIDRIRAYNGLGDSYGSTIVGSTLKKTSSKGTTSSKKSSTKSKTSSSSDSADEFLETWDEIEIKIDRIERDISNLDLKASSVYKAWSTRNSALKSEMSDITKEISIQQAAYQRYLQEADAKTPGLSNYYKQLVQNGAINIEDITDESLADKISEYQEW